MAAAVVAGAVALLLEANPALTPADAKLVAAGHELARAGAGLIEAGAGSLNVAAAVKFGTAQTASQTSIGGEAVYSSRIGVTSNARSRFPHFGPALGTRCC